MLVVGGPLGITHFAHNACNPYAVKVSAISVKKRGAESDILGALVGIRTVVLSQRTLDLDRTFHVIEKGLQEN